MDNSWWVMVGAAISVYAVIAVGGLLRVVGWLTEEADRSLLRLIVRVLMPSLIFAVITNNAALKSPDNLIVPPLFGFAGVMLGFGLALAVTRLPRSVQGMSEPRQFGAFALTVGMFNYGYVPLPLVKHFFNDQTLGVLFVHNVGVELALWTFGVMLLSGHLGPAWWRQMFNPMIVTIVLALAVNFSNTASYLPVFFTRGVEWLGDAAIPLSLLLVGATIADQLRLNKPSASRLDGLKIVGWACALRLGLLPAAFLAMAYYLPTSLQLKQVVVIQAAMPSAIFPIVLARLYGSSAGTALLVAVSTSLASLVTMPFWISAGMKLFGLR